MKYIGIILALLISNPSLATVVCPGGLVRMRDSYKKFKEKCKSVGSQSGMRGFKVSFIFFDDQLTFIID